jgi:hypothetical protein
MLPAEQYQAAGNDPGVTGLGIFGAKRSKNGGPPGVNEGTYFYTESGISILTRAMSRFG